MHRESCEMPRSDLHVSTAEGGGFAANRLTGFQTKSRHNTHKNTIFSPSGVSEGFCCFQILTYLSLFDDALFCVVTNELCLKVS